MPAHTHKTFLKALRDSEQSVLRVAHWIKGSGGIVSYEPPTEAGTHEEWKGHADEGDLALRFRLEVKRISRPFTSAADWPFKDFIVCAQHAWDRATPKPFGILCLNRAETHAAFVSAATRPSWWSDERHDRRYPGYTQSFYVCDKSLPAFWSLDLPAPWPLGGLA